MALTVEVAGYGMCQESHPPYALMVICVQQEAFQAWTVYRRYNTFIALSEQLQTMYPNTLPVPLFNCESNLSHENLESCRISLDQWLKSVTSNSMILRTQSMYQFLCVEANQPPDNLEVRWRSSSNGSFDEMDMDDMFDRQGGGGGGSGNGINGSDDNYDENNHHNHHNNNSTHQEDFNQQQQQAHHQHNQQHQVHQHHNEEDHSYASRSLNKNKGHWSGTGSSSSSNNHNRMTPRNNNSNDDDENDGLDIQSISVVQEAEFLYDRVEEERKAALLKLSQQQQQQQQQIMNNGTIFNTSSSIGKNPAMQSNGDNNSNNNNSSSASVSTTGAGGSTTGSTVVKKTINLDSFHIIKVIGKGSFGKVFLVRDKSNKTLYALKVLKKSYIIQKNQVEHTKTERSVLGYVHHPYIVGLNMAFQTADKLFFVLDYCAGGELFFHLGKVGRFPEERAKFYAAQITLALEYVHGFDIIYRDLKPENVLLDHQGNVRLTDFGLSKEGVHHPATGANSFCGTPEYIAPEVLLRQGHGRAVDWWSLGALLFEMVTGLPPFYSRNRETMFEKIMKAELSFPAFVSPTAKDILSRLLVRDPKHRLGSGDRDANELKVHPFFQGVDWIAFMNGSIIPPWRPSVVGSVDTSQFDQEFTSLQPVVSPDMRDAYFGSYDRAFEGFTFVDESARHLLAAAHGGGRSVAAGSHHTSHTLHHHAHHPPPVSGIRR